VSTTRRQFLKRSAQLAVGAVACVGLGSRASARGLFESVNPRAWRELAMRLSGPLLRPGDPGYAAAALPNNLRYATVRPEGIAGCAAAHDVAESILWCREFDVPLVARCGGHSYAGYSTTRGLMIDLALIDAVEFDTRTGIVTVGRGVRHERLYTALQVDVVPPDATAFVHRNSRWLMTVALYWGATTPADAVQRDREWQDGFYDAMLPFTGGGAYQNFPDPSLKDWPQAYYGSNLPRLEHVKAAVDPTRVFRYPQSIPPA